MRKGLGGVNWLTKIHLVGSSADLYALTLHSLR